MKNVESRSEKLGRVFRSLMFICLLFMTLISVIGVFMRALEYPGKRYPRLSDEQVRLSGAVSIMVGIPSIVGSG